MASPKDLDEIDNGTKHDHAIDSFRYGAMWRMNPVRCPEVDGKSDVTGPRNLPLWLTNKKRDDYL